MPGPMGQFVIDRLDSQGQPILFLVGDMDRHAVISLEERLRAAIGQGHRGILLDLSEVARIDSRGLAGLVAAYERLRGLRRQMRILAASDAVMQMLGRHRLEHMLMEPRVPALVAS